MTSETIQNRTQFAESDPRHHTNKLKTIVRDLDASRNLYGKALGISFKEEKGGYLHTEALNSAKSFSLWPLSQAAESCFGSSLWPDNCRPNSQPPEKY